jgi:hypothetical protein
MIPELTIVFLILLAVVISALLQDNDNTRFR